MVRPRRITGRRFRCAPRFSEAFCNLGNVYFARKQTDLAVASYQQAIGLSPEQGSLLLQPLPRLFPRDLSSSGRLMRPSKGRGNLILNWLNIIPRLIHLANMNRLVVDVVLSPQMLWERFLNQFIGREGTLFRLFKAWFEKVPSRIPFLIPLFFLGFLVGMSKYVRTRRFLTPCPVCGSPTHRFYLGNTDEEYICFNCYRIYIQKERLHPKIAEKKSLQVEQFQKQNHFLGKFLSFFFVGFQDLWGERLLKGLFLPFCLFYFYPEVCLLERRYHFFHWLSPPSPYGI